MNYLLFDEFPSALADGNSSRRLQKIFVEISWKFAVDYKLWINLNRS